MWQIFFWHAKMKCHWNLPNFSTFLWRALSRLSFWRSSANGNFVTAPMCGRVCAKKDTCKRCRKIGPGIVQCSVLSFSIHCPNFIHCIVKIIIEEFTFPPIYSLKMLVYTHIYINIMRQLSRDTTHPFFSSADDGDSKTYANRIQICIDCIEF